MKKHNTKKIQIGNVEIGGNSPVSVQSMCNTDTRDVKSTVEQIHRLTDAGCELVRVAVLNNDAAVSIGEIKKQIKIPLIADIHFDYRLALESINQGIDALRLNPGNIGNKEHIKLVVNAAKERKIPIRIGVNAGSLEKEFEVSHKDYTSTAKSLVKSAMKHIKILEALDFDLIKVSLKASDVPTMIKAYEKISKKIDYPLHLGVTEAGTIKSGLIKSSIGIGTLLNKGIGNTIRVSLTDDPVEEVYAGWEILKALNMRKKGLNLISCPTCGRCEVKLIELANQVENKFRDIEIPLSVAVMGCHVNGPGEAKSADIGIACARKEAILFKKGETIKKFPFEDSLNVLEEEISVLIKSK
jgi:(E)-4-hydroxy-3-methylbut-2-enyl-diphosphate synthase